MLNKVIPNPEVRKWMYGVGVAVSGILIGYGIMTTEEAGWWLILVGALFGFNEFTANRNTPDPNEDLFEIDESEGEDDLIVLEEE